MEVAVERCDPFEGLLHDLDGGDLPLSDQPSDVDRRRARGREGLITRVATR